MALFTDIVLLLACSVVVVMVFDRLRLPALVGFLVAGMIAGPHGLRLVGDVHTVEAISEVGVVLLLFLIGVELSLKQFFRMWRVTILGGGLQVLITIASTFLLLQVFNVSFTAAVFWGILVSLSSTAIALKLLSNRGEVDSPHGRISLGILIFQDLMVAPMILIIPRLASPETVMQSIGPQALIGLAIAVAVVLLARYVIPRLLELVVKVRSSEVFMFTVLVLCLGAALVSARAGLSAALGAFVAGLLISESDYSEQVVSEVIPFRDVFFGLFFVSVGMLCDLGAVAALWPHMMAITVGVILVKSTIVALICRALGQPWRVGVATGLFLGQIGEFAIVLLNLGLASEVIGPISYQLFLAATILGMMITPVLVTLTRTTERITRDLPHRSAEPGTDAHDYGSVKDHVVVAGYGVNGQNLVKVLKRQNIPFVIIEMNPVTVQTARRQGLPIFYGDITRAAILEHAGLANARILVVAISDASATRRAVDAARRINPGVHIIVRTRYLNEVEPLERLGASEVIPEEFETAIEIFVRVLQKYLLPRTVIEHCVAEIRSDSYGLLRRGPGETRPARALARLLAGVEIEAMQLETASPLVGRSLAEAALRTETGATLLAVRRGGQFIPNPDSSIVLQALDILVLMGTPEQLVTAGARTRKRET